jgi:hypothetical protein
MVLFSDLLSNVVDIADSDLPVVVKNERKLIGLSSSGSETMEWNITESGIPVSLQHSVQCCI